MENPNIGLQVIRNLSIRRCDPVPLAHEDLSFPVGAHRVSITRAMKALRESGLVVREGRTLIVAESAAVLPGDEGAG